ncbi:MoaD/ThiS family protein [Orrella daihaiensis]|uniref:MoaD/ThiS family protein n=1 Tax=Orrella daihaiensis TaxID=2782176 RepID=A0ABY4AMX8_9BURK|nr:MoaD/ThiS family protein [Orrella daihaiensis]UOD50981.1 MoaD/ThiS family protein [Orrella daihaiensis]
MMKLQMRYFAQLREQLEVDSEALIMEQPIAVTGLIEQLRERGGIWAEVLAPEERICVAVNQEMVPMTHQLRADAEVALFRPVTGG